MKRGIEMKKVLAIVLLFVTILAGCSSNEVDLLFSSFDEKLVNKDFEGLYLLLSSESQAAITQEEFVTRYNNIYSGIEASNLKTEMGEIDTENEVIPFSLTMDTVAGNFSSSDYELPYIKENGELKILWSEALIFPMMESGDKVRVVTKSSTRGSILDRNGEALASDGTLKIIGIHPAEFDDNNRESKISELATLLDIDEDTIIKKLDANSNPDYFVPIVTVLPGTSLIQFLSNREHEGILIRNTQGRIYKNEEAFGRLLGYIGEITAEQLEADEEGIYTRNSLIGKAGLEQVYEETLRGIDGMEVYIERDGTNIETIALTEARNGSDIKLSIDPNLQVKIYETMNGEKGSATAVDPTTGEILALVSSPSYNSNRYTTYMTNSEKQRREAINYADEANRFTTLYSPGSTFKLITAATGLENGTLDPQEIKTIEGSEWQKESSWGNYKIHRINGQTQVSLKEAVKYSDNIYFAMNALAIGSDAFIKGAEKFTIGTELNIGYPLNTSQVSNSGALSSDILLADSGYGQGQVMVTTLNMALAYSMLSNNGNIMNPNLVLNDSTTPTILKESIVSTDHLTILQDVFSAAVEDSDGTGHLAKIDGVKLAGKTGTAEIKQSQGETGSENGWFVATDLDNSKISIAVVVEDVQNGLGTLGVVSMVGDILKAYLK
ncbi:penicillin-binding transpeptidase domain-containing protein [Turicibacter sanguinis]|nr:penicillin-binding transpeptidase domain-containing protein [Turicibacter sp.]MTL74378.1 penicillin-binding transpeptidase domain-containing protein [Turicibacter sanguinis]MTN45029.1 penicillin-binding transpeptidase domain-containing protein [Turicibacter sanguinis]MTN50810.1 penicillin-binding transpeptidase domain-containing protein [Turicibacter sanguinis]MTN53960.1 penicillin-binding transpeptidase domain-containing protein [Turicibacter sanguinis]